MSWPIAWLNDKPKIMMCIMPTSQSTPCVYAYGHTYFSEEGYTFNLEVTQFKFVAFYY